ncbi:MAG: hypothetical protein ACRCTZ_15040 [Sarcina sp.]
MNMFRLVQIFGQNNPQLQQILNLTQGKNTNQIEQMARNLAKQQGVDIEGLINKAKNFK